MHGLRFYDIDRLYVGRLNGKFKIAYLLSNQIEKPNFINPIQNNEKFDNFELLEQLETFLKQNDLDVLLTDVYGNCKKRLTMEDIAYLSKILERKINLSLANAKKTEVLSTNVAGIISDLLGFNVGLNPGNFDFKDIVENEIIIPAKKLDLFKNCMKDYIQASFIAENMLIFSCTKDSRDYRISRSLHKSKIPLTEQLCANNFSLRVDRSGNIVINGFELEEYKRDKSIGFQKVIKF